MSESKNNKFEPLDNLGIKVLLKLSDIKYEQTPEGNLEVGISLDNIKYQIDLAAEKYDMKFNLT